ncbi:MAG: hypothetical protein LBO63_06110 [Oscillospiraceae bacterium]|nr:hypothetical protein [Oscillospiraceae bacterium]
MLKLNHNIVKYLAPLFAVLLYSWFGRNQSFDLHFGHEAYGIFTGGMLRALAGFCLGITAYMVYDRLAAAKVNLVGKILLSLLEVYCIFRLLYLVWGRDIGVDNFRILIYMPLLLILSYSKKSLLSWLFDNPFCRWLGSITLALYLSHSMLLGRYIISIKPLLLKFGVVKALAKIKLFGSTPMQVMTNLRSTKFDMVFFLIFCVACAAAITYLTRLALFGIKKARAAIASRTEKSAPEEA